MRLEGRDITGLPPEQRCRAGLGRSFQIPLPFEHLSVFENLSVAALFGGGMSQGDTFDCKPLRGDPAAKRAGSYYDCIDTAIPGVQVRDQAQQPVDLVLGRTGRGRAHDVTSTAARSRETTSSRIDSGLST